MTRRLTQLISSHILLALVLVGLTAGVIAQQVSTFRGQVQDERGDAIPNATVTLQGKGEKEWIGKSTYTGDFAITNVPPGTYTLTVAYEGFQTQTIQNVVIPFAGGPLTVKLAIAAVEVVTDVSVNNQAVSVDPDQNMNATVLGEDFIKNLPDNEDDLRDMLSALAGPTASGEGAQIMVDGFNGGRLPPREAIMQIRINQNPFSAEYANPGFGRVEIITKPGLGDWRGGGGWGYRNSGLDARNAFATVRPELELNRFNFNLGGPLVKKRLSTFIFGDRNMTNGAGNTFARTLTGNFVANVPSETVSTFIGSRADYLLNNKNTLNFSYNYRRSNTLNTEFAARFGGGFGGPGGGGGGGGFGGGGFGGGGGATGSQLLPERGSDRENNNHTLRIGETWIVNSKMVHEARFEYDREFSNQIARTNGVAVNVLDAFNGGGSTCCPNTTMQSQVEFQDYLTYTTKGAKHTIKGGVQFEYDSISDLSGSNFNGTYTFSTLDQYGLALAAAGSASAPQCNPLGTGAGLAPCATQLSINQGNPLLEYGLFRGSWFVGDDWRIAQNLTLSLGLRHEFQTRLDDKINFAPRIGIAWSPFKSRKTTIRGGGGVFYERLRGAQYENAIRFNGTTQQSYIVRNAVFSPTDPIGANASRLQAQTVTLRPLDSNLKAPYDINTSIGVEQQLPKNLVATVTYIFSRGINQFRTRNINAPFRFDTDPVTGRLIPIYPDPARGFILQTESSAISETNRIQFGFSRRLGKISAFGNYSLSWIKSNGEGTPANNYDIAAEWGRSMMDSRHNFVTGGFITLPKGFRLNTFINATSGRPFNIITGTDDNLDGTINDRPLGIARNSDLPASLYSRLPDRLICVPGTSPSLNTTTRAITCNPGGAAQVQLRDFLAQKYPNGVKAQSPGNFTVNAYLSKSFGFGKPKGSNNQAQGGPGGGGMRGGGPGGGGMRGGPGGGPGGGMMGGPMMMGMGGAEGSRYTLTLTLGATNLFNRVNFGAYSGTLGSTFFGLSSNANAARQLDFNVRFGF